MVHISLILRSLESVRMPNRALLCFYPTGKTEASKYVMRYLITVANALHNGDKEGNNPDKAQQQHGDFIERCLLRSNTVLEAFGNAKTLRNDNSRSVMQSVIKPATDTSTKCRRANLQDTIVSIV